MNQAIKWLVSNESLFNGLSFEIKMVYKYCSYKTLKILCPNVFL